MNKSKTHSVKILPEYFEAVISGEKTFEIRYNDRDYKVGDLLCLKEFCDGDYTGRETVREICYMLDDPTCCKEGYVVLGLKQSEGEWITKHRHRGGFRTVTVVDRFGEKHTGTLDDRWECDDLYCSVCGRISHDAFLNYCANCGAKMKGGEVDV